MFSYQARSKEFLDLSIAASFRSAQPVLDVVDAAISAVRPEAMALSEAPPPAIRWAAPPGASYAPGPGPPDGQPGGVKPPFRFAGLPLCSRP